MLGTSSFEKEKKDYEIDYDYISSLLPANCYAGYDGLVIKT